MYIKSRVELIYEGQSVADNGSPVIVTISETVRCDEMETFYSNYYNERQRNMRLSKNLVLPSYLTEDRQSGGINYELMYCVYHGKRYKVRNILKLRGTRQRMVLDIQEVR